MAIFAGFTCPPAAAMGGITIPNCPVGFGQVQKLILMRYYSTGSTKNVFTAVEMDDLTNFNTRAAAVDGTKLQITPFVQNPESSPGEPITYGGGNETVDGAEIIIGVNPTVLTMRLDFLPAQTLTELKALAGEVLGVMLVDGNGQIGAAVDDVASPANYYPIRIVQNTWFVSDVVLGGYEAPDSVNLQFSLPGNWSNDVVPFKPTTFDPLTDIANS